RLPAIRRTLRQAHAVIVSNQDTIKHLQTVWPREYILMPANAVSLDTTAIDEFDGEILELMAVGNIVRIRPYILVFQAIAGLNNTQKSRIRFTFLGSGHDRSRLERRVRKLQLQSIVNFSGQVTREEVLKKMRHAHLLVFPSLRDSG